MVTVPFPSLAAGYSCTTFPYNDGPTQAYPGLDDWLKIFYDSIPSFQSIAAADAAADAPARAAEFAEEYGKELDRLKASLSAVPTAATNCLELCRLREEALRRTGFQDAFLSIKSTENTKALALLPGVCQEIDSEAVAAARWELVLRGVCAANIFDLGAAHTTAMYHKQGGVSFHDARDALLPRPWTVDDLDAAVARLAGGPAYGKAILFVDNSGADLVLGMLPLARELLRTGAEVVLAANELPAINDITAAELDALLPGVAAADERLCKAISSGRLRVVSSGSGLPVIDLSAVSPETAAEAEGADLVVLEGMGRAIETNLHAAFTCDSMKMGMVKHPEVAAALGGRMMDCVVKFDQAAEGLTFAGVGRLSSEDGGDPA